MLSRSWRAALDIDESAYALDRIGVVRPVPGLEGSNEARLLSVPVRSASRSRPLPLSTLLLPLISPPLPAADPVALLRPALELVLPLPSIPTPACGQYS